MSVAPAGLDWWKRKLDQMHERDRTFVSRTLAWRVIECLIQRQAHRLEAHDLITLAQQLGMAPKFAPRAIASVTRLGIVTANLRPTPFWVQLHVDRLARHKSPVTPMRRPISSHERRQLRSESDDRCAHCRDQVRPEDLVIDHLIPLSLLGADARANWVVMHKRCNADKWDCFLRTAITLYRTERVVRFGVRFVDGAFWPVVNGRLRYSRRRNPDLGSAGGQHGDG